MLAIWGFDHIEIKHTLYRGKDCMKKFCTSSREQAKNVIDFEKKKMLPLTKEELKSYQDEKKSYICRKKILKMFTKDKNYRKVWDHCHYIHIEVHTDKYRGAAHSICNSEFNVSNEITVDFHNGSNYDYHFIIKELANEFEGQFNSFGENKEKYKTFSVPIKKEIKKINKDGNKSVANISYKIKLIDSARFMAGSLSNLVDNLAEGIHRIKCKYCDCFLEYESVNNNMLIL